MTLKADFKAGDISVDKLELTGKDLALEFSTVLSGYKASLKAKDGLTGASDISCNLGFDFTNRDSSSSVDIALLKDAGAASLSTVFSPYAGFLVGLDTKVSLKNFNPLTDLNAAVGYKTKEYTFGVVSAKAFKQVAVGFHSKVSADMAVAASVTLPTPGFGKAGEPAIDASAGLAYKASDSAVLSVKANKEGKVSAAFAHVLSPLATVTWAVELDTRNIASDDHSAYSAAPGAPRLRYPPFLPLASSAHPSPFPFLALPRRVRHPSVHQGVSACGRGLWINAAQQKILAQALVLKKQTPVK